MAFLHPAAHHAAQKPAEIFVAREGEEGPAVGQHAGEGRDQPHLGELGHLIAHAVELVVEPPGRAGLHLAGHRPVLEIAGRGHQHRILGRVECVEDGARQGVVAVHAVEKRVQSLRDWPVAHGIAARIRTDRLEEPRARAAQRADMKLHDQVVARIGRAQLHHQREAEGGRLVRRRRPALAGIPQDAVEIRRAPLVGHVQRVDAVIGGAAAMRNEMLEPLVKRADEIVEAVDRDTGRFGQRVNVGRKASLLDGDRPVGAEGRHHADRRAGTGEGGMMLQRVQRVVGGADELHLHAFQKAAGAELRLCQTLAGCVPAVRGRLGRKHRALEPEIAPQLQMAPVMDRVADQPWHDGGIGIVFLAEGGSTRDMALRDARPAHQPPFVVVVRQPRLAQIRPLVIAGNLGRRQVIVEIDDRQRRRDLVEEPPRGPGVQKEIGSEKAAHPAVSSLIARATASRAPSEQMAS